MSQDLLKQIRKAHNPGENPNADGTGRLTNDCEETLEIWIEVLSDRVVRAGFWSRACINVLACGSVAAGLAEGCKISELKAITAERIFQAVEGLPEHEAHCADFAARALRAALIDYLGHRREEPWRKLYR
jgi:nitrogen fixation NifU-like protein